MRIAIIGAGTSGLAAAAFLKRDGHDVSIYERFSAPKPLGAGLMLQPTGLAVLACLGLDEQAIARSSRIDGIEGKVVRSGKSIFDVSYHRLGPHLFGLGIHRGTLFSVLHEEVLRQGIPIVTGVAIDTLTYDTQGLPSVSDGITTYGPFDLVINAQGARSPLRNRYGKVLKDKPYPYAAVWGVCTDTEGRFTNALYQRYDKARHMIGVMPVGCAEGEASTRIAFFWSLRACDYDAWRNAMPAWQEKVVSLWPEIAYLVRQFRTPDDLNYARYGDVWLKHYVVNRMVCIGDAAHTSSPQLGQGANMGLLDAFVLAQQIRQHAQLPEALRNYEKQRKRHIRFYQRASHWLTPFFQSDSVMQPALRDALFGPMCRIPYMHTHMVQTLAGIKLGLLRCMNPGTIHPRYDTRSGV